MTEKLSYQLVKSLPQALSLRRLRNTCYQYLTNYQGPINLWQQIRWYFTTYRPSSRTGDYRLYIFSNQSGQPVGYGALQLHNDHLFITECLDTQQRGRGYGKEILSALIEIGKQEKRILVAEIWAMNEHSVALHKHTGFELASQRIHKGENLLVFELRP